MKIKVLIILIVCSVFSCGNDDDTIPSRKEYSFTQNASITINVFEESSLAEVIEGDKLVFEYLFVGEDDPDLADEEFSEKIIFEIDPTLDNFSYTNEALATINTYFTKYCFCSPINSILISEGTIQGTKLDDSSWSISIDVTFNQETRTANGTFNLE